VIRAVIFDCDGVLFDSWHANVAFYNAVLAALGRPPLDAAGEHQAHMLSSPQLFAALFGDDPELVARARATAHAVDYGPFYHQMVPAPRLHELLAQLKADYRLAMATNRGLTVEGVVRAFGLEPYLELAVGINDVPRPKPFPDMLEKCLGHFGIAPPHAVYVGDAPSDYAAARAAGMHFVGVGEHTDAPLCIQRLDELPGLLATRLADGG